MKLALNTNSSHLNVAAWLTLEGKQEAIAETYTVRGSSMGATPPQPDRQHAPLPVQAIPINPADFNPLPVIPPKTFVQFHIANSELRDLYCSILVVSSNREITILFPNQWAATEDVSQIEAGQRVLIPDPNDYFRFVTKGDKGVAEVLIVASSNPLRKTLLSLRVIASQRGQRSGPMAFHDSDEPTDLVANLLDDLDVGSGITGANSQGVRRLDTTHLAVMSIPFEVR